MIAGFFDHGRKKGSYIWKKVISVLEFFIEIGTKKQLLMLAACIQQGMTSHVQAHQDLPKVNFIGQESV